MSFQSAIGVLKDKIFRYKMALHTLEELQSEEPESLLSMKGILAETPAATPNPPAPAATPIKRAGSTRALGRSQGAAEKRRAIIDYIANHPACSSKEIVKDTKYSKALVSWHLGHAKQDKQVEMIGKGAHARWRIAQKSAQSVKAAPPDLSSEIFEDERDHHEIEKPDPQSEARKPFGCDLCSARFHVKGSLLSHMRIVHQASSL